MRALVSILKTLKKMIYVEDKIEATATAKELSGRILDYVEGPTPPMEPDWKDSALETNDSHSIFDIPTPDPTPELRMDFTKFVDPLVEAVALYMSKDQQVGHCLDEYHNVLENTANWFKNVLEDTDHLINQKIFTGNVYNYTKEEALLQKDENLVEMFYYKYAYDKIKKLEFLKHFQTDGHSSEVVANINSFVEKIESRLTDPLVTRIRRVRKDLEMYYITALRKASILERYLGEC